MRIYNYNILGYRKFTKLSHKSNSIITKLHRTVWYYQPKLTLRFLEKVDKEWLFTKQQKYQVNFRFFIFPGNGVIMDFEDDDLYDEEVNIDNTYLTFTIENEVYALCVSNVTEIVKFQKIISIPDVPDYIPGVINLRGKIITVMDMKKRFRLSHVPYSDRTIIIVLEYETCLTGIIVDKVNDVIEILPSDIENSSQYTGNNSTVSGVARKDGKTFILLDINSLLSTKKNFVESLK